MAETTPSTAPAARDGKAELFGPTPFDEFVGKYGTTKRRGIFGYFVHEFGRRIVGGRYPQGTLLPSEPELVQRFGISRTVIREAMKCLAGKGLVEIKTRVGTRVRDRAAWHHTDTDVMVWYFESGPSVEMLRALKDLRRVIEPEAGARAASRGTGMEIEAIAAAYRRMAAAGSDIVAYSDADLAFHTAIFAATHNMIYAQLIDLLAVAIYANRALSDPADIIARQQQTLANHQALLDAIIARDPETARAATHQLLDGWQVSGFDF